MRSRLNLLLACLTVVLAVPLVLASGAFAASTPSTPIQLSSGQVAQALFVAGDVARLSRIPSGTESLVEEKILQQLYIANPTLGVSQAVSDIQGLQATLAGNSPAISPATLTVMAGNQGILAILRALTDSGPAQDVTNAIAQVDNQALTQASVSDARNQNWFDASADSLDTIAFQGFSPANALAASASLAQANKLFGHARDTLWQAASLESVFDGTQTLLKENPALQTAAIQQLVGMLASDGSLQTTVGQLENLVAGGVKTIGDQECALPGGSTGGSPSDCTSGALHDALMVSAACQAGASSECTDAKNQAETNAHAELAAVAAQQAATAAAADALNQADLALGQSELAPGCGADRRARAGVPRLSELPAGPQGRDRRVEPRGRPVGVGSARSARSCRASRGRSRQGKQKSKPYKLGPVSGSVTAGKALTLTIKLPAAAVAALGKGAKESAAFTVAATNGNGTGRATPRVATLKPTR